MLKISKKDSRLTVCLEGEIDHCSAQTMRTQIENALGDQGIKELFLDFTQVGFMDSSGVGMLIGRYRTMAARGGSVTAFGLSAQMERLFRFAGLHRIIVLEDREEEAANE